MRKVPPDVEKAFHAGLRSDVVWFRWNEAVEVVEGEHAGRQGVVRGIVMVQPFVMLQVELAIGEEAIIPQDGLRLPPY